MELLFSNQRSHVVSVPANIPQEAPLPPSSAQDPFPLKPTNISYLLRWMRDNILSERVELFMEKETVYVPPRRFRELSKPTYLPFLHLFT